MKKLNPEKVTALKQYFERMSSLPAREQLTGFKCLNLPPNSVLKDSVPANGEECDKPGQNEMHERQTPIGGAGCGGDDWTNEGQGQLEALD